ncbi:MAG: DUF2520 domain-containing protein [Paludibacteraceae bacterium]|nr:DUF2520 domain-containing protein [Paludibacteraceae bacterium]MCR5570373.1 DUF2520 domain-containing protein [Paludibacteraceae bacterium]
MNIVLLGSGNLATNLSLSLRQAGFSITQVYSKTLANAKELAELLECDYTASTEEVYDADIYISALKDSVSAEVWSKINFKNSLLLHTSGSLDMQLLKGHSQNYGVLYPLMTLSKKRRIDFSKIPILVEANTKENCERIVQIAEKISTNVQLVDSVQRSQMHLAAVWANNFTNHMYAIAKSITDKNNLPFSLLLPLIDETAQKVHSLDPIDAQTGPAVRYDENIISKHINACSPEQQTLYKVISESIHQLSTQKK